MKHVLWFVRLVFVAWMFPAGLNHFVPLFPQPLGNQPLSRELFAALDASGLFDLVKLVELFAGISVLTGRYVPLALLMCMPISFCVWFWDVPLQGWGRLRRKIDGAGEPPLIHTVRGAGYRLGE